ncbi:MAG: YggS family pyridoxal phosphate-dependent enzyme [Actinomycetia bacterium]|nr:YggS family pyridoxal phosphate-dependent enzyme [Actinomycetes bacterium]
MQQRFADVRLRIAQACARSGRCADEVTLVAVSKTVDPTAIEEAAHLDEGLACHLFGENRVQDLVSKLESCPEQDFHMIGTLQRNKVRQVVGRVPLIHSVDSMRLAEAIDARAQQLGIVQEILLQVNVSGEESKHGLEVEEVDSFLAHALTLPGIHIVGLMTMAPFGDPEEARPSFRKLREIRDRLGLRELSMGMSNDYEVAIEEGATIIRVGSALFHP